MKELTPRARDYLVSFGECMSTRIFAAYLNKIGVKARQYDAFDIGFITTDEFTNVDILEATYPTVANKLNGDWISDPAMPIVTGFLGKGWRTCAVTTLGRGGSDLTATTIGKGLGLREIQESSQGGSVLTPAEVLIGIHGIRRLSRFPFRCCLCEQLYRQLGLLIDTTYHKHCLWIWNPS